MSYLRKFAQKYFTNIEDENNVETEAQKKPLNVSANSSPPAPQRMT